MQAIRSCASASGVAGGTYRVLGWPTLYEGDYFVIRAGKILGVQREVRQAVRFLVLLPGYVTNAPGYLIEQGLHLGMKPLQPFVFHLVLAVHLPDRELRVHTNLHRLAAVRKNGANPGDEGPVLCLIIGGISNSLGYLNDRFFFAESIPCSPNGGWAGIPPRGTIAIQNKFTHIVGGITPGTPVKYLVAAPPGPRH